MRRYQWRGSIIDSILAVGGPLCLTEGMFLVHLYPAVLDSFLLYLLLILLLASVRGLYPALLASIVAFFAFDYFFVPPLSSLVPSKFQDILALLVFMITAVLTSELADALRLRAERAQRRERETRILYNLVRAMNYAEEVQQALTIFVQMVTEVFSPSGVRDCLLLLPDAQGCFTQQIVAHAREGPQVISTAEYEAIEQVVKRAATIDLDDASSGVKPVGSGRRGKREPTCRIRLVPLKTNHGVVGVLRLSVRYNGRRDERENDLGIERERPTPQAIFFSAFLEQAVSVIERGRLLQENMHVKALQETDALRSALLSSVSHDLRTPLSIIKTSATSLLEDEMQWNEEVQRNFVTTIEREADRLNSLVENLLDMSRIEAGALHPEKMWYPLDELIHDVLDRMSTHLQGREVRTHIPVRLPPVQLDYVYIDQVMTNLLENVLRHTPADSPIDIRIQVQDGCVLTCIADRGPGIPFAERERIFDKFYRVLGSERVRCQQRSSGLGLAICRGLIEAHGGQIRVDAREGGGAIFCFSLPLTALEGEFLDA